MLTKEQLELLLPEEKQQKVGPDVPEDEEVMNRAIKIPTEMCITIFTCGHSYEQPDFEGRLVPAFEQECENQQISQDLVALPVKIYKNMSSEGQCELPCPSCMFSQIK